MADPVIYCDILHNLAILFKVPSFGGAVFERMLFFMPV